MSMRSIRRPLVLFLLPWLLALLEGLTFFGAADSGLAEPTVQGEEEPRTGSGSHLDPWG